MLQTSIEQRTTLRENIWVMVQVCFRTSIAGASTRGFTFLSCFLVPAVGVSTWGQAGNPTNQWKQSGPTQDVTETGRSITGEKEKTDCSSRDRLRYISAMFWKLSSVGIRGLSDHVSGSITQWLSSPRSWARLLSGMWRFGVATLDLRKAFDRIEFKCLFDALRRRGVPGSYITHIHFRDALYGSQFGSAEGGTSFGIVSRVKCDVMSPSRG